MKSPETINQVESAESQPLQLLEPEQIANAIADSEAEFKADPKRFAGFVRKITKTKVDFHWARAERGKPDELTINRHGVVCSRTVLDGKTWYQHTLDPFGTSVGYMNENDAARLLLKRFVGIAIPRGIG